MSLWTRLRAAFAVKAAEGAVRPGPYPLEDGWLPPGTPVNFWQIGQNVRPYGSSSAMVEACISAYSQTVAMCPGDHWRLGDDGGRVRVTTSALSRFLRRPNGYQSSSDFLLNLTRSLYATGNAYALALRNERNEIAEAHLMPQGFPRVGEDGSIFYGLSGNEVVDHLVGRGILVPARDVLHVRLHTPRHPLRGETPVVATALDLAARDAAVRQQLAFFMNQSKPSFILSTDQVLDREQVTEIRRRWNEVTKGEGAGGTPILSAGLKPHLVTTTAEDAQLAETLKMSDQNVALAFRVPLQVLGIGDTPYASTEMLMQSWVSTGLGFALNHIEEALGQLFGLRGVPDEYVEFSTKALLRSAFKDRIEALARGVQSGIFSPDEARREEELPKVKGGYGEEPRVQQQVLPLSHFDKLLEQSEQPPAPPPPSDEPSEAETAKALLAVHKGFAHVVRR